HPRRPPAHRSVSLLHSPKSRPQRNSDSSNESDTQARHHLRRSKSSYSSPSSLQPLGGKGSSGESSNADKWFEKSNNEPTGSRQGFADNEPPFFMHNSSSEDTPPDQRQAMQQQTLRRFLNHPDKAVTLPLKTGLLPMATDGSSTEDFRSVIDDLTIQNKKLKRRLKKYEKLHDSHLKDEKLFEVRIHGLPPDKKHELEDTLRKFAAGLSAQPISDYASNAAYMGLLPTLPRTKTASSQASIYNADSAYASMSASGQGSSGNDIKNAPVRPSAKAMHQNIHSYLHHIPEGLLPQQTPTQMTERSKKKLVIRRLEQIFAGKGAFGAHQQMLQQQEVSNIAAHADRTEQEASGVSAQREGYREAMIMNREAEDPLDPATMKKIAQETAAQADAVKATSKVNQTDFASDSKQSPEQRPTRPLDLDPHRAQVPAENIWYIRHLGFSPPEAGSQEPPEDGHGWIYLNLLINMAQLHTLNVTAEFVRKALQENRSKFELSHDCRKVRWKGGTNVTQTSSTEGGSSYDRTGDDTPEGASPRKRAKLAHGSNTAADARPALPHRINSAHRTQPENKLIYTPLFFHKDGADGDDSSSDMEDDSMSSPFPPPIGGDSSGMTSSGIRTTSIKPRKQEDGPIIFYNNARFITDLSGDREPGSQQNVPPYRPVSLMPVGMPTEPEQPAYESEKRGPLYNAKNLPEPMDLHDNPIPPELELSFPYPSPAKSGESHVIDPLHLEVSGIGGVSPADNFIIVVDGQIAEVEGKLVPNVTRPRNAGELGDKVASVLQSNGFTRQTTPAVEYNMLDARVKRLRPSHLPPALSYMPLTESTEEGDSDIDDEMSIAPESLGDFPPSTAPQAIEVPYTASEDEDNENDSDDEDQEEDGDDDDSDGSVDLLAAAREADPDAIREKEREYDANLAERLAEEIPAGSSAATAGGGSGFASP
ncbi:hypothetical protein K431DRAFT_202651, partial [Polychaeton citri CBS 116435]